MDILLKQRMIGAIVLVSLGVIFIPMLLSGRGDADGEVKSNMPPLPTYEIKKPAVAQSVQDAKLKLKTRDAEQARQGTEQKPDQNAQKAPQKTVAQSTASTPETNKQAQATPKPKQAAVPAVDKAPATEGKQTPKQSAAVAQSKPSKPSKTRAEPSTTAEKAVKPARKPTPVVHGWVVQVGSFELRKNANNLRDKLRKAGFASFVEPRKGDTTVYRVRVGPEKQRGRAEDLKKQLSTRHKLNGLVMKYP